MSAPTRSRSPSHPCWLHHSHHYAHHYARQYAHQYAHHDHLSFQTICLGYISPPQGLGKAARIWGKVESSSFSLFFFFNKCLSLQHPCPDYFPQKDRSTPASYSLPAIHSAPTIHITVWSGTQIFYHLLKRCRNPTAPLLRGHNVTRAANTCADL